MTPLTIINTELDYLLKINTPKNDDTTKSLKDLKDITNQMIHIVRSLLLLSKDAKSSIKDHVFNLTILIKNKLPEIYQGNLLDFKADDHLYVRGNEEYFLIVIQNLIDNGLKYSNYQKVSLEGRLVGKEIVIKCADSGIGISDIEKGRIFERFYRSERAEQLGIKGFGLGLSLAKFIVNSMDGKIEIESNIPKGSVVIIKLPKLEMV